MKSALYLSIVVGFLMLGIGSPRARAQGEGQALWQAAFDGDLEAAKRAVQQGADVNYRGRGGFAPLLCAARNGHLEIVKFLLDHGANIDQDDNNRHKTALLAACFDGHMDIVKLLVDRGANLNNQGVNGWTPLHDAAYIGNVEVVKYLVDHGARLDLRNERGETAADTGKRGAQDAVRRGQTSATPQDFRTVVDYIKAHGG